MFQLLSITLILTCVTGNQPPTDTYIEPHYHFNGLDRPLMVTITSPRRFGPMTLALMTPDGQLLHDLVEVGEGEVDLAGLFPEFWSIRETCYLQLMKRGEPEGSALVLVPMLSRMMPVTEKSPHPVYGGMHTRIVGWRDENAPESSETSEVDESPDDSSEAVSDEEQDAIAPERFFTGFRAYVERDVVFRTTHGDIRLAMRPDHAPNTVWNFLQLCKGGFYRDVTFHRVVPLTPEGDPFVIQAGDPTGHGEGGPGYWLPIEPSELPHDFGVISMARSDHPDTAGSQIFICLSREGTARLDVQYCSFGYAVDGATAILSIADTELADVTSGLPADPPNIRNAELVPSPPRTPDLGRPDHRVTRPQAEIRKPGRVPR